MIPAPIQELIEFDVTRQTGPLSVPLHVHHYCQLDVVIGGSMDLLLPGRRIRLKPGDCALIPPLLSHGYQIAGPVHHAVIKARIPIHYAPTIGRQVHLLRYQQIQLSLARSASQWLTHRHPTDAHALIAVATICLCHAFSTMRATSRELAATHTAPPGEFWRVVDEVISSPHLDWTVAQLAARCDLSEGHFTKKFIEAFEQTPQRFLLDARIRQAIDRMNRDQLSIKAAAQATGYATVHSFTRAFKRAMGVSPAAYMKSQGRL